MKKINRCEVCGNSSLIGVLDLGLHPMCDDLVDVGQQRVCREYPIEILFCETCITCHQAYQVPKVDLFPRSYHYRARFTSDVREGMKDLVNVTERLCGSVLEKIVLDIGCNDGTLLSFFAAKGGKTIGVEPTDAYLDAKIAGHDVYNNFFDSDVAERIVEDHGKPDIITFTNVFAHIENLDGLLEALELLLGDETVLVIENHYLGSVIERDQFDTFYHEHPRTYSLESFQVIARRISCAVISAEFPARYGGNIRVFLQRKSSSIEHNEKQLLLSQYHEKEKRFIDRLMLMGDRIECWKLKKTQQITEMNTMFGPLRAKAFPGRAAILVKLLGIDIDSVESVYEKPGSLKLGHYLPGTHIEILSDDQFDTTDDRPLLNLAWHIPAEIEQYMRRIGYGGMIVNIVDSEDFSG
jgi:SAM-dependent methyltransferase